MTARIGGIIGAVVSAALLAACGDDVKALTGTATAACDWTAQATTTASTYRKCQQATGPAAEIESGKADCGATGGVLRDTCPPAGGAGLVGCCSYAEFGLAMTLCYYDAARYPTVAGACQALTVNGDPAVWTTTVPSP